MRAQIKAQPFFLLMMGISALAMFVPATHASILNAHAEARAFFYSGLLLLIFTCMVAIARNSGGERRQGLMHNLLALCAGFTILPLFLAVPFYEGLKTTTFVNAYFEMVSSLTTTGATLFDPARLSPSLHLWRAIVGWFGGLLIWIAAAAVLAPLSLGGFEVTASGEPGQSANGGPRGDIDPHQRILRVAGTLTPVYAGLTFSLFVLLLILGDRPLVALSHAMAVMATSGISPVGGLQAAASGMVGEFLLALFMLFALSRVTFSRDTLVGSRGTVLGDPEFRLGLLLVVAVPLLLFLRHWVAALEGGEQATAQAGALWQALWGAGFTVLSFLSTTGFESAHWGVAESWSGLKTPGLLFLGLGMIGGGVATTAGGVKLLRVWALYLQGLREMDRMMHPSSVGRSGRGGRRLRKQGAFVAWIFFMLFATSLLLFSMIMGAYVPDLEQAVILAVAALSTTGPMIVSAAEQPIALADMAASGKLFLCAAMVIGRLELLAIIALASNYLGRE